MSSAISKPDLTIDITSVDQNVSNTPQKVLFVGETRSSAFLHLGLNENISNSTADINDMFGQGGILSSMLINARKINTDVQFDAIAFFPQGGESGSKRTVNAPIVGTATANGTFTVIVGSKTDFTFETPVLIGDTATDVGDAIEALITANLDCPFSATSVGDLLQFQSHEKSPVYNEVGFEVISNTEGITVTVTEITAGSGTPFGFDSSVFDVVGDRRYQTIVWPFVSSATRIGFVKDFLDDRFNVVNDVLDGVGVLYLVDDFSGLVTEGNLHNSQSLVFVGDENQTSPTFIGPSILELPYVTISDVAAIRSLRLQEGTNISEFTFSRNGSLDGTGGPAMASKPYFNTPLSQLATIPAGRGFSKTEIVDLNDAGITVLGNNLTSTSIIMGEFVTTYKTDTAGNPDVSFKILNYVDTASNIREFYANNAHQLFSQSRLTEGDLIRGRDMINEQLIRAAFTNWYSLLSGSDFVLTQAGEASIKFFKDNFGISVDLETGTVTIITENAIVTQLRTIIVTMQVAFSTSG